MNNKQASTGLKLNEALLWEKGREGRTGFSFPKSDVPAADLPKELTGDAPDFPELSEVDVIRHYTRISQWNFGIDTGMYPLGSCTMKYNPKINDKLAGLSGFTGANPLIPSKMAQGLLKMMYELEKYLATITGMDAVTLQPAAGAQGELSGMMMIDAYHKSRGEKRTKIIVPDTAHGTNPASAALCGFKAVSVKSNDKGILSRKAITEVMDEETAGIMVTNPNTVGLFEENIREVADIVHSKGGQVYCDGANMNAVMGIVDMGRTGIDLIHLNLHKTFSTPHGGGGPGAGPVCVKKHLIPFLPVPRVEKQNGNFILSSDFPNSVGKFHAFYGNVGILIRAYCYIRTMGIENLKKASELAVLNANYIKEKLKKTYHLAYDRPSLHECVFSDKHQAEHKVSTLDIAKRLMDYGFHPPTIYFPLIVKGALMIEPTETESKNDIDIFIDAMESIAKEAKTDPELLLNAPTLCKVRRLDETLAARHPELKD